MSDGSVPITRVNLKLLQTFMLVAEHRSFREAAELTRRSQSLLGAELLKSMTGTNIRHIRYKSVVAAMPDLIGGRVTMMSSPLSSVLPLVREGKLRPQRHAR